MFVKVKIDLVEPCFLTEYAVFERVGYNISHCHGNGFVFIVFHALFLRCLWVL